MIHTQPTAARRIAMLVLFLLAATSSSVRAAPTPLPSGLKTYSVSGKQVNLLRANTEVTLLNHSGAGCLTYMWFAMDETTRIRVYVNGETTPSIDMASDIGAGYAFGGSPLPVGSPVMGRYGGQFYNYHIPYQTSIRVTILPTATAFNSVTGTNVWYTLRGTDNLPLVVGGLTLPPTARLYLYRNEPYNARPLEEFNLCSVRGAGMLYLAVVAAQGGSDTGNQGIDLSFLEGCFRAYVDGSATPMLLSSGTEDYFLGSGYFYQNQLYYGSVGGLTSLDKSQSRFSAYRFHDTDPVFFDTAFRMTLRDGDTVNGRAVSSPPPTGYTTYVWLYQW